MARSSFFCPIKNECEDHEAAVLLEKEVMKTKYPDKGTAAEISLVSSLYPHFNEAKELVQALYGVRTEFIKKNPSLSSKPAYLPTQEEVLESFQNTRSLHLKGELDPPLFLLFLGLLEQKIIHFQPGLKEGFAAFISFIQDDLLNRAEPTIRSLFDSRAMVVSSTPFPQDMVTFILTFSLATFYQSRYRDFLSQLDTFLWEGGYCPVCAVKPHYGLLHSQHGAKTLECWLCGIRWNYLRIKCPYCGNTDQKKLGYFKQDQRESIGRVDFCQNCLSYYKIFDMRDYEQEDAILPIHHLATLSWDLLARQEGFQPGSELEWLSEEELHTLER